MSRIVCGIVCGISSFVFLWFSEVMFGSDSLDLFLFDSLFFGVGFTWRLGEEVRCGDIDEECQRPGFGIGTLRLKKMKSKLFWR